LYKAAVSPPPNDSVRLGGSAGMPLETASLSVAMKGEIKALVSLKDEVFTHNARFTSAIAYRYTFDKT
jgi:hypothetical protein